VTVAGENAGQSRANAGRGSCDQGYGAQR